MNTNRQAADYYNIFIVNTIEFQIPMSLVHMEYCFRVLGINPTIEVLNIKVFINSFSACKPFYFQYPRIGLYIGISILIETKIRNSLGSTMMSL